MGVPESRQYTDYKLTVKPEQILMMATDGLWESRKQKGEMFGKERVKNLNLMGTPPPEHIAETSI